MAKKGFDRMAVLDHAILLFWQHGYTASSVQLITQYTGLKPGSLYHEFESKEGLFKDSLSRYAERSIENIRTTIDSADSVTIGIQNILDQLISDTAEKDYCSCFLIKTQLELAAQNNDLHRLALEKLASIERIYADYLAKLYDPSQSKQLAQQLMLVIYGIRVAGYQQQCSKELKQTIEPLLPWLYKN